MSERAALINNACKAECLSVRALGMEAGVDEPSFVDQQSYWGHGIVIWKSVTPCCKCWLTFFPRAPAKGSS